MRTRGIQDYWVAVCRLVEGYIYTCCLYGMILLSDLTVFENSTRDADYLLHALALALAHTSFL